MLETSGPGAGSRGGLVTRPGAACCWRARSRSAASARWRSRSRRGGGFAGLAGQGFLDGPQYLGQLGLVLLAGLELLVAFAVVAVQLGQGLLALLAGRCQRLAAAVQLALLAQLFGFLRRDVLLDVGQLAEGFVEAGELFETGFVDVVVVGEGAAEFFRVFLVQQQLQVFLASTLVGRAGLDGEALLLNARVLEFSPHPAVSARLRSCPARPAGP